MRTDGSGLTARAVSLGLLIGATMCVSNSYFGAVQLRDASRVASRGPCLAWPVPRVSQLGGCLGNGTPSSPSASASSSRFEVQG